MTSEPFADPTAMGGRGLPDSLAALGRLPAGIRQEFEEAIALGRRFTEEVVRPAALDVDLRVSLDPDYLPLDFVRKANEWGLFSRWIPRLFGGGGMAMLSLYAFMEEISVGCAGLANIIGAHYLGVTVLCSSCNLRVTNRILREVAAGERSGRPCTLSLAWTEPDSGSEQFEKPLLPKARVRTRAEKVAGGYRLNGNKVFISGGHLATWHMVIAYEDLQAPADTLVMLAVKAGTPGFRTGRHEHKMGQKGCVASELVFDDCFVPDADACHAKEHVAGLGISPRDAALRVISLFPAVTKPGVGAIGAGVARAATEAAATYAAGKPLCDSRLADQQWAQLALADMHRRHITAKTLYMEAAYAAGLHSMIRLLYVKPAYHLSRWLPGWCLDRIVAPLLSLAWLNRHYRWLNLVQADAGAERHMSGLGSLVKVSASDLAYENCISALDLMGADGTRHALGAEKLLRDARLLQIYEGTNEINRINLFAQCVAPAIPGARVFS